MILLENRIYQIGKDCPYGYYLALGKSLSVDMEFNRYETYPPKSTYIRSRCYFGCVKVEPPYKVIRIENGEAIYIGDKPFNLYETINKAELTPGEYSRKGVKVLSNAICEIRVHFRDSKRYNYWGDTVAQIRNQIIFSINGRYYWGLTVDVKSFKPFKNVVFSLKNGRMGRRYVFGEDGFEYSVIHNIGFSVSDNSLKYFQMQNYGLFVMELPVGVDPYKMSIEWLQPSISSVRFYATSKTIEELFCAEYSQLSMIIEKYNRLGIHIEIDDELAKMKEAPDFAKICAEFLEAEYKKAVSYRNKEANKESRYTFHVGASFDKKYYCAAKLAERAIDVSVNSEKTVYYITFDGSQTEEIALMYYDLVTAFNAEKDYMVEIRNYLYENDFSTYLPNAINKLIASLREEYGYSSFVTNSLLVHINKSINTVKHNKLNELYLEMIREHRVTTRWSSEYKLFTLIQNYFPDAIYQYHSDWLKAQSYDIFLPSHSIAIEYQGQQHYEPVEAFGGKDSFKDNIERDIRKRNLSVEHGVAVLDWKYDVPINEITVRQFLIDYHIIDFDTPRRSETAILIDTHNSAFEMAPIQDKAHNQARKEHEKHITQNVIRQYDKDGHFLMEFDTVDVASAKTGVSVKSIKNVLYGSRKSGGGYIWKRCKRASTIEDIQAIVQPENSGVSKPIIQMDLSGHQIAVFRSMRAASISTGINVRSISDALSGTQKTAGGYRWKYQ